MSFRWIQSDKRYLLFNTRLCQSWPHLFMELAGAKARRTKWCEDPDDGWIYEIEIIDTGPHLKRLYV